MFRKCFWVSIVVALASSLIGNILNADVFFSIAKMSLVGTVLSIAVPILMGVISKE